MLEDGAGEEEKELGLQASRVALCRGLHLVVVVEELIRQQTSDNNQNQNQNQRILRAVAEPIRARACPCRIWRRLPRQSPFSFFLFLYSIRH